MPRYRLGFVVLVFATLGSQRLQAEGDTIRVSGAFALYPLMVQWAREYERLNPATRIDVSAGGAGKGMADTLSGLVDLGMVSREIAPEEIAKGARFVPVARDATFPIMNAANPVAPDLGKRGITKQTAKALWLDAQPMTWAQLAGRGAPAKVQTYTRSDACGAADAWAGYLGARQSDLEGVGVYGDPGIAEAVRKDVRGIGYCNLGYAYDARTGLPTQGLMVIPLDGNGNGKIDPDEELPNRAKAMQAIRSGAYPAPPAKDLYLVAKGSFKGPAAAFVSWILDQGQKLVDPAGYVAVGETQLKSARSQLKR
jgi:phosphate transport system substrate-binding protein